MKKLFAVMIIVGMAGYVNAKNLQGSLGLGLGWTPAAFQSAVSGIPVPDVAVTKIGFSEKLVFEPTVGLTFTSYSDGGSDSESNITFRFLMDYVFRGHKKTNLYLKGGLSFSMYSPRGDAPSSVSFGIPVGFGIEHFASDHFSINLDAISGFTFTNNAFNIEDYNITTFTLGNNLLTFYFMWYY